MRYAEKKYQLYTNGFSPIQQFDDMMIPTRFSNYHTADGFTVGFVDSDSMIHDITSMTSFPIMTLRINVLHSRAPHMYIHPNIVHIYTFDINALDS